MPLSAALGCRPGGGLKAKDRHCTAHGQEQGREVSRTVTAQGSKLAQAQAPGPSLAAPFGAGAARPGTATWRRRDVARDTQTQTTRVPDPSSSLQPPAAAGPSPLRPLPARGPRSQGGCPGSDQRSGVAAGTSFCKEPRERLPPARPGGWTAVASSGSWRCPVGCAAPPPCKAPRSEPCSSWIIRTVDLVGAGYSAGSWGAKREQSSDHHTEQTGYWGKDSKEVTTQIHLSSSDTAGAGGPVPPAPGSLFLSSPEPGLRSSNWDSEPGLFLALARLQEGIRICYQRRRRRRRRSQAGPQRPTPSLPAARSAHRRPAAELAVSPSRGRRRRGAPAPRPHAAPSCKPPRGCSARLRLYSQAGAARAAGGGGPRGAGGGRWGRAARGGRPHPCPRAAGAVRGAGTREKRAVGEGVRGCGERESCTRRLSVHLARPPLPPEPEPEPGPVPWGRGEGQAGARRESPGPGGPAAWGSSMSESSSKSSQPLASKQEKDGAEKRGRGRPRKQPPKEPSEVPTPKRPRGRPKGSKNKGAAKTRKTTTTPGRKPRGRPKKLEKEEEEGISQESSEEEQ
ncbi:hypothetical protein R6Z07F_016557 [Ovis aries]